MNQVRRSVRTDSDKLSSINWVVTTACAMALLHFGQSVIEPIALAGILSLAMAPLVRQVRQLGFSQTTSTLVSVGLVGACAIAASVVMAMQVTSVATDLPRYSERINSKIEQVRELAARPFEKWERNLGQIAPLGSTPQPEKRLQSSIAGEGTGEKAAGQTQAETLKRVLSLLWAPIGEFAIVLVLLLFVLQEHESLRDKIIRAVGEEDVARTIRALSDAGEGVSRFIFLQFTVNLAFAVVIGVTLWLIGVPHAALWGTLGGLLRFVPYVGVPIASLATGVFAAAVDPGWSLLLSCMGVFFIVELLLANAIEPYVYGHSTGIAPLTIVLAALFWGTLWGPVGLLLSTPLTVCLVVAGRHVRALSKFTILLGDAPGLTKGLRFYQRALSAEYGDIIQEARSHLRRNSLASYCDHILLPGLAFAAADFDNGRIDQQQQDRIRATIVRVAESHETENGARRFMRPTSKTSLTDKNVGTHLRRVREARSARPSPAAGTANDFLAWCTGIGSERSEVLCELMVRSLGYEGVNARHLPVDTVLSDMDGPQSPMPAIVFIAYPLEEELPAWRKLCVALRSKHPEALLVTVHLPPDTVEESTLLGNVDLVLHTFSEAVALASGTKSERLKEINGK